MNPESLYMEVSFCGSIVISAAGVADAQAIRANHAVRACIICIDVGRVLDLF
jgi:hypothetical protein